MAQLSFRPINITIADGSSAEASLINLARVKNGTDIANRWISEICSHNITTSTTPAAVSRPRLQGFASLRTGMRGRRVGSSVDPTKALIREIRMSLDTRCGSPFGI